jgi:hypothetical protein
MKLIDALLGRIKEDLTATCRAHAGVGFDFVAGEIRLIIPNHINRWSFLEAIENQVGSPLIIKRDETGQDHEFRRLFIEFNEDDLIDRYGLRDESAAWQEHLIARESCGLDSIGNIVGWVYFASSHDDHGEPVIKIGYSENPLRRIATLRTSNPWINCIGCLPAGVKTEGFLHAKWSDLHVSGEWFRSTDELRKWIDDACNSCGTKDVMGTVKTYPDIEGRKKYLAGRSKELQSLDLGIEDMACRSIVSLGLPRRAESELIALGIESIPDLISKSEADIYRMRRFTEFEMCAIGRRLLAIGLMFRGGEAAA